MPGAAAVGHVVRLAPIVKVAHGEEDLILVGLLENPVVEELPVFIKEIEAEPPTFQPSADEADIVGALFAFSLLEIGDGALSVNVNGRPFAGVVVNDDKLLLFPGRVMVDEVAVHHRITMRVPLLEHDQTCGPVVEGPLWVGVGQGSVHPHLFQTIDIAVGPAMGHGFGLKRIVVVVYVHVAKEKVLARGAQRGEHCEREDRRQNFIHIVRDFRFLKERRRGTTRTSALRLTFRRGTKGRRAHFRAFVGVRRGVLPAVWAFVGIRRAVGLIFEPS